MVGKSAPALRLTALALLGTSGGQPQGQHHRQPLRSAAASSLAGAPPGSSWPALPHDWIAHANISRAGGVRAFFDAGENCGADGASLLADGASLLDPAANDTSLLSCPNASYWLVGADTIALYRVGAAGRSELVKNETSPPPPPPYELSVTRRGAWYVLKSGTRRLAWVKSPRVDYDCAATVRPPTEFQPLAVGGAFEYRAAR